MRLLIHAVFDECLNRIRAGDESVESYLARYPRYARQLRSLLELAISVEAVAHPELPSSSVKAIEQRLMRRAAELGRARGKAGFTLQRLKLRAVPVALALILAVVVTGATAVNASADSLPGSPLYGVKRATEQVELWLTPEGASRAELHVRLAAKRLDEVAALAEAGEEIDPEVLRAVSDQTELALAEAEKAEGKKKSELLQKLLTLTERQQVVLNRVKDVAPPAAQQGLQRALEVSARGHERARAALAKEKPQEEIKPQRPTHTPKPTKEPKPTSAPGSAGQKSEQGQGPKATKTPKSQGQGPKATKTPKSQGQGSGSSAKPSKKQ